MEKQLTGLEILLNMFISQPQYPYQNMMTILKTAPRIRLLDVDGMNMSGCANVFSWLDRYFSSCQSLGVCMKDEIPVPSAVIGTKKEQEHTGSQLQFGKLDQLLEGSLKILS